jgi:hypothetical protein
LTASKAKTIPSRGPTIATNSHALGSWTWASPTFGASVNRYRKMDEVPVTWDAADRIVSAAKYIGIRAARPRTMIRATNRADHR